MKFSPKKTHVSTTVCFTLALVFLCMAQTAMAQSSMRGFAGGSSAGASSATEKSIPAPQTSGKWQLKYNDPGIYVTLKNWNCRYDSMWKLVTNMLDGFRSLFGTDENAIQGEKTAQVLRTDYSKVIWEDMEKSPRYGVFNPYFGSSITETHPYCYTDAEVEQYRAYLQGLHDYLRKQRKPIAAINRMFPGGK